MFRYFENRKTTYFNVSCLNFSVETKIKTLFLISYFNLLPKVPFRFFYNLKYKIRNQVLIFVSILKLRHKT